MKKGYKIALPVAILAIVMTTYTISNQQTAAQAVKSPIISTILIPEGSAADFDGEGTFDPQVTKVVIGVNNTVNWKNNDYTIAFIEADNDLVDPVFYETTNLVTSVVTTENGEIVSISTDEAAVGLPNVLLPGESFEYTFTIPGEYGFHGKPWQRGMVIVLAGGTN